MLNTNLTLYWLLFTANFIFLMYIFYTSEKLEKFLKEHKVISFFVVLSFIILTFAGLFYGLEQANQYLNETYGTDSALKQAVLKEALSRM